MRMREQNRIDARKLGHSHSGTTYPRQKKSELVIEIGIRQYTHFTESEQQRGMPDIGDMGLRFA